MSISLERQIAREEVNVQHGTASRSAAASGLVAARQHARLPGHGRAYRHDEGAVGGGGGRAARGEQRGEELYTPVCFTTKGCASPLP